MSVRIGINPLTWTIDDLPEVGGETSLETCLTEARAAGFEGVELGCKFPRTAPELKAALAPHGLALVSGWYSTNLLLRDAAEEFEAMRAHRELLSALGCDVVVVAETTRCIHGERGTRLSQRPVLARPRLAAFRRAPRRARREAARTPGSPSPTITTWARSCRPRTRWTG